ncbi:hypothetical protein FRX31_013205 [Thalictrum thalictroides]|uniref:Uncharacterized protein n=1 Tax=Thalictrum thalictroides TaxID=46969 RepID=A0A7J6WJV4_THATH|nr:hypothetical protein FRX31_013205 [Thalictrum thalictroides]
MLEMEIPFMDPPYPFPIAVRYSRQIKTINLSSVISNPNLVAGRPQRFSRLDLIRFTSEFSEIIGTDDFGVVYKGIIFI